MKQRIILLIKSLSILLTISIVYLIVYSLSGIGLICPLNALTNLLCPFCGISRMCISLLKLDFESALYFNSACLFLLPIWIFLATYYCISYVKSGSKTMSKWFKVVLYLSFLIMLIFCILRNMINIGLSPHSSIFINNIIWR